MTITISDALLILAAIIGPIAAVQVQKWIERSREIRARKLNVFHTLMATRGLKASSFEHVQALNSIDLFFDKKEPKENEVITAWTEYLDHLNRFPADNDAAGQSAWMEKGTELLAQLLQTIGSSLGYNFTKVELKRSIYHPRGHDEEIAARIALREILTKLANGAWNLPLDIKQFPIDPAAFKLQLEVQSAILAALSGKGALNVEVKPPGPDSH